MKLLNTNHICIYYSQRCNYNCTYCINLATPVTDPPSRVEESTEYLERFLKRFEGKTTIAVSGGEPLLWKDLPILVDKFDLFWILYTNLHKIPEWLSHPRIRLVIAAYHPEHTDIHRFIQRASRVDRLVAKVMAFPGKEEEATIFHTALQEAGIVAHLAPSEYPRGWSPEFITQLHDHPTSLLYNSRFYSKDAYYARVCPAGTDRMFQITPTGAIEPCSEWAQPSYLGTIFAPRLHKKPVLCGKSCYCEWHSFNEATLANENGRWQTFIDTGHWHNPTSEELDNYVEAMQWN